MDSTSVTAVPGGETSCTFRVRNTGMIVDQVLLDVLGDASPWATVEPAQLNMLPGSDALAHVIFRPPRSASVAAGVTPFAIRAMSTEDPGGSVIEEGAVEVARFSELRAELSPTKARGSRRANFRLIVHNDGNTPEPVAVSVSDPDLMLDFRIKPMNIVAPPGTATYVRLRTAPKKRFLKGQERTLPFQGLLQGEDSAPATVNGVMLQEQMLPKWLLPAIATAGVLAAALVALWFTVLKPQVHSMATQAVQSATSQMASSAAKAQQAAQQAQHAVQAQQSNGSGSGSGGGGGGGGSTPPPKSGTGTGGKTGGKSGTGSGTTKPKTPSAPVPISKLLTVNAAPATTFTTVTFAIPANETLSVSDLLLENPQGDTGLLQIRIGTTPIVVEQLADYRSMPESLVQPFVFTHADPLVIAVKCQNTGATSCSDDVTFSGTLKSTS